MCYFFHLLKDLCGLFIVIQRWFIGMFVRVKLMGILWILPYFSNAIDSGNLIFSMRLLYGDFNGSMRLKNIWYFPIILAR